MKYQKQVLIERRKAYVEFTSRLAVSITTPFFSKQFKFAEEDDCRQIDLVTLKNVDTDMKKRNFYAVVNYESEDSDGNKINPICTISVFVRTGPTKFDFDEIGKASLQENKKTFEVHFKPN